jgi:hypothetical protein
MSFFKDMIFSKIIDCVFNLDFPDTKPWEIQDGALVESVSFP